MEKSNFHSELKKLMKEYVHTVYDVTENFPKSELFGSTSQFRRAALSVLLNYTEGFARKRPAMVKHFCEMSYGSLKESLVLVEFTYERKYLTKTSFEKLDVVGNRIAKMMWGILSKMDS